MNVATRRKAPHHMTVDEFLAWSGDERWELIDGEPRAMAPASATHGLIQARLATLFGQHLDATRSPCVVVTEPAVQPRERARSNLRVSHLAVTCSPIEANQIVLPDPVLIVEILSASNEAQTWENVWTYTTVPSAREILVVRLTRISAELLQRRSDGTWPDEPVALGPDDTMHLVSIGLSCPLSDVYARTHLMPR